MRCILHVGVPRTGTTSVQQFLRDQLGAPTYPVGVMEPNQHIELAIYAAQSQQTLDDPAWRNLYRVFDVPPRERIADIVGAWAGDARRAGSDLVLSSEVLASLRFDDEADRLIALLRSIGVDDLEVIIVRRDPASFLASYREALAFVGVTIEPEPWMVDFDRRITLWSERCDVHVFDLEQEMETHGSIIPAIARVVGTEPVEYRLNSREWLREQIADAMRREQQ